MILTWGELYVPPEMMTSREAVTDPATPALPLFLGLAL